MAAEVVPKVANDTRNHSSGHPSNSIAGDCRCQPEAQDDSEIEIDLEETDCEEQTSCRNKFNKRRISS